jgi:putative hydrolase of the HAD superfamily
VRDKGRRTFKFVLFDLDDTLYPRSVGIMTTVGERIRQFIVDTLALKADEAAALQKRYFHTYGTTLRGLQDEHHIDPDVYLAYVHDFPLDALQPTPELDRLLARIPLTKVIVTNASAEHAQRVLERLGIAHHFDAILDIRAFDYFCKPDPRAYERVLARLQARPEDCILIDDSARNLLPARRLGMTTILMDSATSSQRAEEEGVDYTVTSLDGLRAVLTPLGCFTNGAERSDGRAA